MTQPAMVVVRRFSQSRKSNLMGVFLLGNIYLKISATKRIRIPKKYHNF